MDYTLYFSPDSANIVVRMILEELGLTYEEKVVPAKRCDRDAQFLELNPRGLLPVLIDKTHDAVLFETGAICLYLADLHKKLAPALAPALHDSKARANCLKWLFLLSNTLHADLAIRFYPERYVRHESDIPNLLHATARRVHGHLELFEEFVRTHKGEWLLGTDLSVCDFYLAACIRWAQMYPVGNVALTANDLKKYPSLLKLLAQLQGRASVKQSFEKEGIQGNAFISPDNNIPARTRDVVGSTRP